MRLAHFTDIHITEDPGQIGWRDLLSKRFLGWINLAFLKRHSSFRDAARIAEALVRDLEEVRPDHIVCTGDLTGLALQSEFDAARQALAPLFSLDHVTAIPGNHDVYVAAAVRQKLYERSFGSWTRTDFQREDFPPPFRSLYPYPLVRLLDEKVALICLMDVRPNALHDSSGRVGKLQLSLLEELLRDRRISGRTKILALHCGVYRTGEARDGRFHRLRDGKSLLSIADRANVSLIIHGHSHVRFVVRRGDHLATPFANPGSLTSSKHARAYHIYRVKGGAIELEVRRYDAGAGQFVPWPDAPGSGVL